MHTSNLYWLIMVTLTNIALTPCVTAQSDLNNLYGSQLQFSLDFLTSTYFNQDIHSYAANQNLLLSPYTIYNHLILTYFGASGKTEQELMRVLHLDWAKNKSQVILAYRFVKLQRSKQIQEFSSAVKIYFDQKVKVSEQISEIFFEELESLDFSDDKQSALIINNWIANVSSNEIEGFVSSFDVPLSSGLFSVGAAYYKGRWAEKFDPRDTKTDIFYFNTNTQLFVKMMRKSGSYHYTVDEDLGAHVLQMPFAKLRSSSSEIAMVIILPPFIPNGLHDVLTKLTPKTLKSALDKSVEVEVDITLPKFQFELNSNLEMLLIDIGLRSIYDDTAEFGNFFNNTHVKLHNAVHYAKLAIDENGQTEDIKFRSIFRKVKFDCNHPFLFLIYDHTEKLILFAGIYRKPE